jgi:type 1 glutamine amidotransferase
LRAAVFLAAACACALASGFAGGSGAVRPGPAFRVLVFTKTAGFRHDSIPAAIAAVEKLGAQNGFAVDATEGASVFNGSTLPRYAVVMFLLTTGDVLDSDQQAAFMRYIQSGGGFVGVHSASDTEHDWSWYGGLVGTYFAVHPTIQQATIDVVDRDTPSTIHLPAHWTRTDEWYNFTGEPSPSVTVLANLDENTYQPGPGAMGASHPIAWQQVYDGGRSWYTAGGHTIESYSEPLFLGHILGGILWAAGFDLPAFKSLNTRVVNRRFDVIATHTNCYRCTLQVRILLRSGPQTTTVDAAGTRTEALTPPLPPGSRHRYSIVLSDEPMAAHVTRRGWITVP